MADDYLKSTRTPPLSRFEIQAGWEIPAALEQGLNSDLPGELKALVMSNVYDTATGQYLLIPQGARLVGSYNSRVGYGQSGVQVAWQRVIFPDGRKGKQNGVLDGPIIAKCHEEKWLLLTTDHEMGKTHIEEIKKHPNVTILATTSNPSSRPGLCLPARPRH